ncbi:MAG: hypothetical protein LAN63_14700 [Acidobacteriia bacterium]|nr:hypothetical protein [Terriglobia bacterium]
MIGVIAKPEQLGTVEEFFELFKTPWEFYRPGQMYDVVIAAGDEIPEVNAKLFLVYSPSAKVMDARLGASTLGKHECAILSDRDTRLPIYGQLTTFADGSNGVPCVTADCGTAGLRFDLSGSTVIRLGYDLFDEVGFLLSDGQPVEHAHIPTLDLHIGMLRNWILNEGIPLVEIPPAPVGHSFTVCLTHDIDFIGIRNHKFDHSMWGFAYRGTVGAVRNLFRGRISASHLFKSWRAVASLPFVYAGWAKDFWEPFEWYLDVEKGLPATYFLIPFKRRAGESVARPDAARRATAYDVSDLPHWTTVLMKHGCELGVHGIDSWHDADRGREELARVVAATGRPDIGTRIHWLLRDANTPSTLERAGYAYDSTCGYNETVGYRAGTGQVFRPLSAQTLLELPLHIQDGALFFPERLDLPETEAEQRCQTLVDNAGKFGGVLTVLWHDRSHGPERFWGDFYVRLVQALKSRDVWFGTAGQTVAWFRKRREVRFERVEGQGTAHLHLRYEGEKIHPPLRVRVYPPRRKENRELEVTGTDFSDISWNGESADELEVQIASRFSPTLSDLAVSSLS